MYKYETHLHTFPVSKCSKVGVRENLEFYQKAGFAGVFITNHFLDGNISVDRSLPYDEQLRYYFSDYYEAVRIGKELNFPVFLGLEISYRGTDFLIYGLDKAWFLAHPEIREMQRANLLALMMAEGALVIQAHPFAEASYIDHIRLFPRYVHGAESYNAARSDFENEMAEHYVKSYGLIPFAGSDNHVAGNNKKLGGMQTETPIESVQDFIARVKNGTAVPFRLDLENEG